MPIPKRLSDGWAALDAGTNSGIAPNLILPNQSSFSVNLTNRGGWPKPRPGFHKVTLNFEDEATQQNFQSQLFQLGDGYVMGNGNGAIICMIGGRQYLIPISPSRTYQVQDITIAGDPNQPQKPLAWGAQGLNYYVIQNGSDKPFIFDGAMSFRAGPTQIPVGNQITCYENRFWVAKGSLYAAGNMAFDASAGGTAPLNFKDSILYFTENTLIAEGGAFALPAGSGDITGFKPIASSSPFQSNGQGELIITTLTQAFAANVPLDRTQWKNTTSPIQRVLQLSSGVCSQDSMVIVNEDIWYRTLNGIAPVSYTVRNQGQWGNRVLSTEVDRVLRNDAQDYLPLCSGVEFNNRLIMTANPSVSRNHGIYHRALVALDFFPISSMSRLSAPAWEGAWSGLRFLKIFTVVHQSVKRCYGFVLNQFDQIELWEITKDAHFDNDGDVDIPIPWQQESRSMNFGSAYEMKQLESSDLFIDDVDGAFSLQVQFRPDSYPCWVDWQTITGCADTKLCGTQDNCPSLPNFKPQYRPKNQLQQPPDTFDPITGQRFRTFYELQVRFSGSGYLRMKQMRLNSTPFQLDFVEGKQLP